MSAVLDHTVLPAAAESALDAARIAADPGLGLGLILSDGTHVQLPEQIRAVLRDAATAMATGRAVSITPINTVLTTQQAAELLGVTRPTLVRLLESGAIPFTQPGRHRRVQLADLVGYQARQRADRRAELSKMTTDTTDQELHRAGFCWTPGRRDRPRPMPFRVVLDACVLAPHLLCDVMLHLAEDDVYVPLWSGDILDEVDRRSAGDSPGHRHPGTLVASGRSGGGRGQVPPVVGGQPRHAAPDRLCGRTIEPVIQERLDITLGESHRSAVG